MTYQTEPPFTHGTTAKTGVLLVNLGTPDAPTARAVRPYLKQFLGDARVVEIPKAIWWLILNGIILNIRPKKSAEKYASIWLDEGSPLRVYTEKQTILLKGYLGERSKAPFVVDFAMTYGNPSISDALNRLKQQNCQRILIVPMFPQYAASATAPVFDQVFRHCNRCAICLLFAPSVTFMMIRATSSRWLPTSTTTGPSRSPRKTGDEFSRRAAIHAGQGRSVPLRMPQDRTLTGRSVGSQTDQYIVSFQSRFGKAEWIKPYTTATWLNWASKKCVAWTWYARALSPTALRRLKKLRWKAAKTFSTQAAGNITISLASMTEGTGCTH